MNNPFVHEQAVALAGRVLRESPDHDHRIERAWALAWSRPPTPSERVRAARHVEEYARAIGTAVPKPGAERQAWISLCRVLLCANEFLYLE
jgi:hypothetical protein